MLLVPFWLAVEIYKVEAIAPLVPGLHGCYEEWTRKVAARLL